MNYYYILLILIISIIILVVYYKYDELLSKIKRVSTQLKITRNELNYVKNNKEQKSVNDKIINNFNKVPKISSYNSTDISIDDSNKDKNSLFNFDVDSVSSLSS